MQRKQTSIGLNLSPLIVIVLVIAIWQAVVSFGLVPRFMMPAPTDVINAFGEDWQLMLQNLRITLIETVFGLLIGILLGLVLAILMDRFEILYRAVYPLLVISQTIPTVAIAPLLILWLGYGVLPKIVLIIVTTFFPVAVEMLTGFRATDPDMLRLMASMGVSRLKVLWFVKLPNALDHFFASLRISVTYAVISAVVAEWVGGYGGLGVYMIRVMKAYAFDKMFAVIVLITALSLLLMALVNFLQYWLEPWRRATAQK